MKKNYLLFLFLFPVFLCHAQTNVSGGIYSNTTWTLSGSPYIVVDTLVVFPGKTLTIQPGVVVKFDNNKYLEIRRATLIANGNAVDSITFTSNSLTPTPGIWRQILLSDTLGLTSFNFCNFKYASTGIVNPGNIAGIKNSTFINNITGIGSTYNTPIDSCTFKNNTNGIYYAYGDTLKNCNISNNTNGIGEMYSTLINCIIDSNVVGIGGIADANGKIYNCEISHNQKGIDSHSSSYLTLENCIIDYNSTFGISLGGDMTDSVINCEIKYNGIGLIAGSCPYEGNPSVISQNVIESNATGIQLAGCENIYCNKFCNNTTYDLENLNSSPYSLPNNYWCTADSDTISMHIYDGYDNVTRGLVTFGPVDVNMCYLTGCNITLTPHVTNATCDTCHNGTASISVGNGFPQYTYSWFTSPIQTTATATGLASGTYTVCITDGHGCTACNYNVFVDSTNCTGYSVSATATNASCSLCSDGMGVAHVTAGTAPFIYTWYTSPIQTNDTATLLPVGNYAVCVTDLYGCIACDTITVGIGSCSAYYTITANGNPHTYDLTNMASGTPPLTYDWNWGDGSPHDTAAYPTHTYSGAGTYTICLSIIDSAGCTSNYCHSFYLLGPSSSAVTIIVIPPTVTNVQSSSAEKLFTVYPNPVSSILTIAAGKNSFLSKVTLYSSDSRIVKSVDGGQVSIVNLDLNDLSSGIYFLDCISEKGRERIKVVKY